MLGKIELKIENIPIDIAEPTISEVSIQKGNSNIEPSGTVYYLAIVKVISFYLFLFSCDLFL